MLQKDRHPNLDFFVADFSYWAIKDDMASMEHPMFSLSKKKDFAIRRYTHNGVSIVIEPSREYGMPTIWDKDILIFCCSQLVEGMRHGRDPKREIVFGVYDFLVSTNRSTGKKGYDAIVEALQRLGGVRLTTNIETGGEIEDRGFTLIGEWEASFEEYNDRIRHVMIELPRWLYRAVTSHELLTLHKNYFRLGKGIDRRLYELCRKHCGHQPKWEISLPLLYKKSGARDAIRNFRLAVKHLAELNYLPEYRLRFHPKEDKLTVYSTGPKGSLREINDRLDDAVKA
jgi:plasmid replication initiation protein